MKIVMLAGLFLLGVLMLAPTEVWAKRANGGGKGDHKGKDNTESAEDRCFKPDVLRKIFLDNPGLPRNFLTHSLPDTPVKLGDGKTYPLYQLNQFLQANFRIEWYARKKEGEPIVSMMATRLRKLMALPDFYDRVMHHKPEYIISPKGKVSAQEAYNHFRRCDRRLGVTAKKTYHAPVGGGGGIGAPSWAVWKAMNLFEHETCHCIGIGHNSGGLSGPIAGTLRKWDKQKKWNYPTIDANTLVVTPAENHAQASTEVGKVKKGKKGKKGKKDAGPDLKDGKDGDSEDNMESDAADEMEGASLDAGPEDDVVNEPAETDGSGKSNP